MFIAWVGARVLWKTFTIYIQLQSKLAVCYQTILEKTKITILCKIYEYKRSSKGVYNSIILFNFFFTESFSSGE